MTSVLNASSKAAAYSMWCLHRCLAILLPVNINSTAALGFPEDRNPAKCPKLIMPKELAICIMDGQPAS